MTVNSTNYSAVSNLNGYYNNAVQGIGQTYNTSNATVQGIPVDVLEIGSKSLFAGASLGRQISRTKGEGVPNDFSAKMGNAGSQMLRTGRNAALVSGLVSAVSNTAEYIQGNISGSRVGGNITADVIGGLGSGIVAAGTGSLLTSAIGSGMGAGIVGFLVGTAAFIGSDILYRNSGVYQTISDKVSEYIDRLLNRNGNPGGW